MLNYATAWGADANAARPIHTLTRTPGVRFIGVTRSGREVKCTVCSDGAFFTDTQEIVMIVGWRPLR